MRNVNAGAFSYSPFFSRMTPVITENAGVRGGDVSMSKSASTFSGSASFGSSTEEKKL